MRLVYEPIAMDHSYFVPHDQPTIPVMTSDWVWDGDMINPEALAAHLEVLPQNLPTEAPSAKNANRVFFFFGFSGPQEDAKKPRKSKEIQG